MKPSTSVNTFLYLILTFVVVTSVGCGPDFGEKIVVNSADVYYKDGAAKADAERLSKQLEKLKFIDGKPKSVQLGKRGDVWEFRIVTSKPEPDQAGKDPLKLTCLQLSPAFDGDEFEVHLCNQKLESKTVVKGMRGKVFDGLSGSMNSYYYRDVELDQVKDFASIVFATDLDNSTGFNYHLSQSESAVQIRMARRNVAKDDKRLANAAHECAVATSGRVFGGKQVDVLICDEFFETQNSYSSSQPAAKLTP